MELSQGEEDIISGVAPILILLLLGSPAAAQDPKPKNNLLEESCVVQRHRSHVARTSDQWLHGDHRFG